MIKNLYVGKTFEYFTHNGLKRTAIVEKVEFHDLVQIPVFIGISPFGNEVKLTRDEIHKFQ